MLPKIVILSVVKWRSGPGDSSRLARLIFTGFGATGSSVTGDPSMTAGHPIPYQLSAIQGLPPTAAATTDDSTRSRLLRPATDIQAAAPTCVSGGFPASVGNNMSDGSATRLP